MIKAETKVVAASKEHGTLPDNKTLSVELAKQSELQKYMKRVMPFVQATREKMEKLGPKALALTLEFDEHKVLTENSIYLTNTLDLDEISIHYTDEENAPERTKDCCPGQPQISFVSKPGVAIEFVNPIPHSGLFSHTLKIISGESHAQIVSRLCKDIKAIKDIDAVQLWRYEDHILGDRKMVPFNKPFHSKVLIPSDSIFNINGSNNVSIKTSSGTFEIGRTVAYVLKD